MTAAAGLPFATSLPIERWANLVVRPVTVQPFRPGMRLSRPPLLYLESMVNLTYRGAPSGGNCSGNNAGIHSASGLVGCSMTSAEATPVSAGSRLGPYELVKPLAQGGMADVYLAKSFDRHVAIKVLSAQRQADADSCAMFLDEA